MCIMCDGASRDEVRFKHHADIHRVGWSLVCVWDGVEASSWTYSIGLSAGFDHPEFVTAGRCPECAGALLNRLGDLVKAGHRFADGDRVIVNGQLEVFGEVDRDHFDGDTFNEWLDYYECLGPPYPEESALEVYPAKDHPRLDIVFDRDR